MICLIFPLCALIFNFQKAYPADILFCMFLCAAGLGNYYNEVYQIGESVVPADLYLALFVIGYVAINGITWISRKSIYLFAYALFMLALGMINDNQIGQILRDVKNYIYFFTSYLYIDLRKEDCAFLRTITKTLIMNVIFTAVFCTIDFVIYGITGIPNGVIYRTFGIGIAQYGLAAAIVILMPFKDCIQKRIGALSYYLILLGLTFLCIVSYTRSVWVQFVMSIFFYTIILFTVSPKVITKQQLRMGLSLAIFALTAIYSIYLFTKDNYAELYGMILSRAGSILNMGTGEIVNNNYDTFLFRIKEVVSYSFKYRNARIIWGWGFGDMKEGAVSGITENSFLYYSWKYGLIAAAILGYKIVNNIIIKIKSKSPVSIAVAAALSSYYISGGISGHFNKYYILPFIACLIKIDFDKVKNIISDSYYGQENTTM